MEQGFPTEKTVNARRRKGLVVEGTFAAEVEVELLDGEDGWAPYLSLADANRLDGVRRALRSKDLKSAGQFGRVFELTPVSV
jgi:hypothetical protein